MWTMTEWSVRHCGWAAKSQKRNNQDDERYGRPDETG
jgi:hypothetical protein